MKKLLLIIPLLFLVSGCFDMPSEIEVSKSILTIQVQYDSSYTKLLVDSARVIVKNVTLGLADTGYTNNVGIAAFPGLRPGTYDLAIRKSLKAEQYFALTGLNRTRTLNGNLNQFRLVFQPDSLVIIRLPK